MKAQEEQVEHIHQQHEEVQMLRQSLVEATETIEYMVNSLMWSAEYKILAESKEKLWKLKKLLTTLDA